MSFKSSLKMPTAIFGHIFVYFALEIMNSFFFFKAEKQEFAYYFMAEVDFISYLGVSG